MSPFALSVLKYSIVVLLYFFVFRALRSVAVDVGGRRRGATSELRAQAAAPAKPGRSGKVPAQVVVHDAGSEGKPRTVRLSGSMEVGRADRCAIRLQDHYVSQVHARLYEDEGAWFVEDLGSTNGTFLNDGTLSGATRVHVGDAVRLGKTVLELRR